MSTVYLELIENFLSSELAIGFDAKALGAVDTLTREQLQMFADQWGAIDRSHHEHMAQTYPFSSNASTERPSDSPAQTDHKAEVLPTSALFAHPYNGLHPLDLDLLKRQALLFSRISVIAPDLRRGRDLQEQRNAFATHLSSMLDLKPLIQDGTVELVPMFGFYSNEIEGGAGIVRSACKTDPAVKSWISSQGAALEDFARSARKGDPFFDAGIRICSALTYGHTFAATHPFVGGLFRQLLSDAPRVDRSRVVATHLLHRIDLPGFAQLTWKDIKSVRDNEECLARWRADLQVAISSVDPDLPADKFVERFDSQVQAQLTKAALDMERELAGSSAMARFKQGGSELLLSAVATAGRVVVEPISVAWEAVKDVCVSEGPKEALRLMWGRKNPSAKHALRTHYAVFSRK